MFKRYVVQVGLKFDGDLKYDESYLCADVDDFVWSSQGIVDVAEELVKNKEELMNINFYKSNGDVVTLSKKDIAFLHIFELTEMETKYGTFTFELTGQCEIMFHKFDGGYRAIPNYYCDKNSLAKQNFEEQWGLRTV